VTKKSHIQDFTSALANFEQKVRVLRCGWRCVLYLARAFPALAIYRYCVARAAANRGENKAPGKGNKIMRREFIAVASRCAAGCFANTINPPAGFNVRKCTHLEN
jgi:hypothetical protein